MINLQTRELVLKWKKEGKTQQQIAELVGCHQSAICRFLDKHKKTGSLKNLPRSGRPTKLSGEKLDALKVRILEEIKDANKKYCSLSTKHFSEIIHREVGRVYTLRHVGRIMHKLGFSLIMPRSQHLRHNQQKVDEFRREFKKNFKRGTWVPSS